MIWVVHPGSVSRIQILFLPIPDPGVKKAPDPGSGSATCFIKAPDCIVPVNDILWVDVLHAMDELAHVVARLRLRDHMARLEHVHQGLPRTVLQHNVDILRVLKAGLAIKPTQKNSQKPQKNPERPKNVFLGF